MSSKRIAGKKLCDLKQELVLLNRKYNQILGRKPNFIIIGAQKAGTTSLYYYLSQHPQVVPSLKKEIQFFSLNYKKGMNWYLCHFPIVGKASSNVITGEASPYYIFHPQVARRLKDNLPEIKLIVLLRNPTERAISHYFHNRKKRREKRPLIQALKHEKKYMAQYRCKIDSEESFVSFYYQHYSYLSRGLYAEQLEKYLKIFDREQILVLESNDFFKNTESDMKKIYSYLRLDDFRKYKKEPKNVGIKNDVESDAIDFLNNYFEEGNKALYALLGVNYGW